MDKRIRLAVIAPSLTTGGAETMIARLVSNIDTEKFNLKLIVLRGNDTDVLIKDLKDKEINVEVLSDERVGKIKTSRQLNKVLRGFRPQVIHSHISGTIYSLPWALFHRCSLVHTIHTKPDVEFSKKISFLFRCFCKTGKLKMVAVSKKNYDIAKDFYKLSDKNAFYVNNPVPIEKFFNRSKAEKDLTFINVSRQDENKNQKMILDAFALVEKKYPNAKLVLVGDGNQHKNLIEKAKALNISEKVNFVGEASNVEEYLADADVYLSASHREGLPLSMLEAMAAELPIISTNVGGCSDIVDGNGILINDDDTSEMYRAMILLIENTELRRHYGRQSLLNVAPYDVKICAREYEKIYCSEVKKH